MPGVIGIKHAVGVIDSGTVLFMAARPRDFAVLAGDDVFASALLGLGAEGGVLASAHVLTSDYAGLIRAWLAARPANARTRANRLTPISAALFAEPNPAVIKGVLHAQGRIPSPAVRLPLLPASQGSVRAALDLIGPSPTPRPYPWFADPVD
jgi:4-hydroxy-tetrahydrodipicolinate synthase